MGPETSAAATTGPAAQVGEPVDLVAALRRAHAALDAALVLGVDGQAVGWAPLDGLGAEALGEAVRLAALLEGRTAGLKLHVVAAAEVANAKEVVAAADTGAWAARSAGGCRTREWGSTWLATLLAKRYHHVARALARGVISEEHAVIIVRAAERVPDQVSDTDLAACEEVLVAKATAMTPRNLRRAARRLLEPLSQTAADQMEAELLAEQERGAEREAWLQIHDNEDGTYGGRFVIPELHGQLLLQALERLSAPRRRSRTKDGTPVTDLTVDPGSGAGSGRLGERLGAAWCELIEHLPATGHARSGITVVVHVAEETLRSRVGAGTLSTGGRISAGEVLRLACGARQMPMVLDGRGVPLHLGAGRRLFTAGQYVALSAMHTTCAAEGCERPYAWTELHHLRPWAEGGPTDLENAVPLCGHHHRRVHDPLYEHQRTPAGEIRFTHRWPSRRRPDRSHRPARAA
jgi:hypothetical protein